MDPEELFWHGDPDSLFVKGDPESLFGAGNPLQLYEFYRDLSPSTRTNQFFFEAVGQEHEFVWHNPDFKASYSFSVWPQGPTVSVTHKYFEASFVGPVMTRSQVRIRTRALELKFAANQYVLRMGF